MPFTINDAKELIAGYQPLLLAKFTFRSGSAQATATITDGAVASIAVDDGGADCAAPPHVTIVGDGIGAAATAEITDGIVSAVNVTAGGAGYTFAVVVFGDVLYLSTKDVVWNGTAYQGRLSDIDLAAVQMLSESGVDIPPSLTLHLADSDSALYLNWEEGAGRGFKGARVELRIVFYDVLGGVFSSDSIVRYVGICDPATPTDDSTLEVRTNNRLNASKKMLPTAILQQHCWKIRPRTARQCAEAANPDSDYYPCGITDPDAAECYYSREGCQAAGNLPRFSGITFAPPRDGGKGREYTSGQWVQLFNSSNDAKYGEPWPLVLGRGWVECPVLNVRQDGNYTRMDVGLTVGQLDSGAGGTVGMKVVVNGHELPPGGYDSASGWQSLNPGNVGWWNWKGRGGRDGDIHSDTDPYGSEATIECVVPRQVASGESIPQVSVLFSGPVMKQYRRIQSISVSGEVATVTFYGANTDIASADPDYAFEISGSALAAINGAGTGLTDWEWGPPGTVQFNAPGVPDGTGAGGLFVFTAPTDNPAWHLYDVLLRSGWMRDELDLESFALAADTCAQPIDYTSQYE